MNFNSSVHIDDEITISNEVPNTSIIIKSSYVLTNSVYKNLNYSDELNMSQKTSFQILI